MDGGPTSVNGSARVPQGSMAELMDSTKHSEWDLPFGGSSNAAGGWKSTVNSIVEWLVS